MFADPQKNVAQFGIEHGMSVADLGAGTGFYSIEAAKLVGSMFSSWRAALFQADR